jgi:hypothetical protein
MAKMQNSQIENLTRLGPMHGSWMIANTGREDGELLTCEEDRGISDLWSYHRLREIILAAQDAMATW